MKKVVILVLLLAAGLFLFLRGSSPAEEKNSLMEDAVAAVMAFSDGGDASKAVTELTSLAGKLEKLNAKSKDSGEPDSEITDQAEQLRAELANASLQLEISDQEKAAEVSAALDKFINQ